MGPPADPQAGLDVLDRRLHQVADHLFEAPGAASAHPRDGRRNQGDGEQAINSARRSSGRAGSETTMAPIIPHRAGDASKAALVCLPIARNGNDAPDSSMTTRGRGRRSNLAGAMAGGHLRRQSRTTVRAGLGIMIGSRRVRRLGRLALALLPARLAARAQAPGAPPLLLPRRRLAQSIAGTSRRSVRRAVPPETAPNDQFVFRQEGKGFTIHWILECITPRIQSIKPTKSARSYSSATSLRDTSPEVLAGL